MVKRNPHFSKLHSGYLFPEINKRKKALLAKKPEAQLISLGIGDTTQPIAPPIAHAMKQYAAVLATTEGYSGYGPEQGQPALRERIASKIYNGRISPDDIFISDGTKCDIGRLQLLFGSEAKIAVQDPSYPVYVDSAVIVGQTGTYNSTQKNYHGIHYMPCVPENDFFPSLSKLPHSDVIYFCSPNNPTGAVATKEQLTDLVTYAQKHKAIIVFDAAYACYIRDETLPRSIYEIEGARDVAIELGSFSKMAGFTGLRLGWSVVPPSLYFDNGTPIRKDWERVHTTIFNGASNIVQQGGLAALSDEAEQSIQSVIDYYMGNANLIRQGLQQTGIPVYGGVNAPYLWAHFKGKNSWDVFDNLLETAHILTTPGSGFGPAGHEFIRLSAFAHRNNIQEAIHRLHSRL